MGKGEHGWTEEMPSLLSTTVWKTTEFLASSVSYLGPLRKAPQVVYSAVQVPRSGFIGTEGEFTAAALHAFKDKNVVDPSLDPLTEREITLRPLREAIGDWLDYLQLAKSVETESRG